MKDLLERLLKKISSFRDPDLQELTVVRQPPVAWPSAFSTAEREYSDPLISTEAIVGSAPACSRCFRQSKSCSSSSSFKSDSRKWEQCRGVSLNTSAWNATAARSTSHPLSTRNLQTLTLTWLQAYYDDQPKPILDLRRLT